MKLTFPRLVVALTFIALAAMAVRPSVDTDTWWHLRAGQWIVEHRAVPTADPFSHTRAGAEWRYPGWLVEAPMFWLFLTWGYAGLNLFTAFFVVVGLGAVYVTCEGGPLVRAFTLVLAAAASAIFWSARPQIVSFALAGIFASILYAYRWRGRNSLWVLVPLMTLWANSHGGFAIGFLLIGLTLAGQIISLLWGWIRERAEASPAPTMAPGDVGLGGVIRLAGIGLACAAAVVVNPSGPAMLLYPFKTISIGVLRDFVQEWQSPNFHEVRAQIFLWLLFATLALVGLAGRRANLTDLLLVCGVGYLGFLAWRNVPLLSLVAPPLLTRHALALWDEARARFPPLARLPAKRTPRAVALNWALLILISLAALLKISVDMLPKTNETQLARIVPIGAAEYVRQAQPPGQLFNSYNFGGYLTWALYPDYPVFVDGRTDLYDDPFLREYLVIAFARPGWRAALEKYGVRLALVESNSILADQLVREADWRIVYQDPTASVFQRTDVLYFENRLQSRK